MSSVTTRIELLNKNNFDTWKLQVEALLIKNETWVYVSGEKPKPKLKSGDNESANEVKNWEHEDRKARSDLILSISPSELKQIKNCETSCEMWKKLHEIYASKGPARKATLLKKLITHKMADGIDVKVHLDDFFDAVDKLNDMDINVNDDLLTIILLYSLPESFENFRCAIETRDELPKPDALRIKIIEEFEARKSRESSNVQKAMFAEKTHGNKNKKYSVNSGKISENKKQFRFKCHRCRKVGHKAADCYEKVNRSSESSKMCTEKPNQEEVVLLHTKCGVNKIYDWCLDSGCTSHMSPYSENFQNLKNIEKNLNLANGGTTKIQGIGEVKINVSDGKNVKHLSLQNVMFVPDLYTNLLSIAKITDKGLNVKFTKYAAFIIDKNGKCICIADRRDDLYYIRKADEIEKFSRKQKGEICNFTSEKENMLKWHQKLGHINFEYLINMSKKKEVLGMKVKNDVKNNICEICIKAKQTQSPFKECSADRTTELLEIIHTDVCGPMRTASLSGMKYFVTFIDDKSRWCEVFFIKKKNEVINAFKQYKAFAENFCGKRIKFLQSDNGLEYCNKEFDNLLKENGIQRRLTVPHTPQQNGIAERKNRTLIETARSLMIQSNAPPRFWAEAINTANYIQNRCINKSLNGTTPHKMWTGKRPCVSYFRIFGIKAFALNKEQNKDKFSPRSKPCILLGYSRESKAYRLWDEAARKLIVSRDVIFTEDYGFKSEYEDCFNEENEISAENSDTDRGENVEIILHKSEATNPSQSGVVELVENYAGSTATPIRTKGRPKITRTGKKGRPKKVYHYKKHSFSKGSIQKQQADTTDESEYESANFIMGPGSLNLHEVLEKDDANEWKNSINEEYLALVKNETFDVVDLPENVNLIKGKFVLTTKYDVSRNSERKKARLVARGFAQRKGIEYNETFSPVIRANSIRVLMALAVKHELIIHQMDVVTAYLNGELNEKVYMEIPELFECNMTKIISDVNLDVKIKNIAQDWLNKIQTEGRKVCLLKKLLYGLKQSGRQWYHKLDTELELLGFKRTNADPCIYIQKVNSNVIILAVYVDDMLIISNKEDLISNTKDQLKKKFEMKDLGKINNCLGIEFQQSENYKTITMCQKKYTREILNRFGMKDCKPVITPLDPNLKLRKDEISEKAVFPYQSLIGSLMYLATSTRPVHWKTAKRVLRYLQKTIDYGLIFRKSDDKLVGFADSDWGASIDDRRSYTGYVFTLSGACVSWESRKQRTVALSSTEAEYMALSDASKEALYLKRLLVDLHEPESTVTIFNDNQGAQQLTRNPVFHNRTKHIDVRYHFIREAAQKGEIDLKYMPTEHMPADFLTKALPGPKFNQCRSSLGIENIK